MRRLLWAALAAAALSACSRRDWSAELEAQPLHQRAEQLRQSPACAGLVPVEYGRTIPVPAPGGRLAVLFYPLVTSPGRAVAVEPQVEGGFSAEGPLAASCARRSAAPTELGPAVRADVSMPDYDRAQALVFSELPEAAGLFWSGAAPGPEQVARLKGFAADFRVAAEPPLLPAYYRLDPQFWEWLRRVAGDSIPKP